MMPVWGNKEILAERQNLSSEPASFRAARWLINAPTRSTIIRGIASTTVVKRFCSSWRLNVAVSLECCARSKGFRCFIPTNPNRTSTCLSLGYLL
ncbi:hypothetical protein Nepgr_014312 [Nepenthes gracilis]|uniref:Uncharacterized protein n=1 Tax=Nepenthes gracilis TaxID=150966 RepID=A0AAD3SKY4_NEPGR|nr:hypothetical protein Nepgr_014312 [Nepenthes gracilis]